MQIQVLLNKGHIGIPGIEPGLPYWPIRPLRIKAGHDIDQARSNAALPIVSMILDRRKGGEAGWPQHLHLAISFPAMRTY
jgi:hypothetical protein